MKTIDEKEKEKLWEEFCIKNKGHINIGTKKDVIFWTYDKLLLNQIEARKEILKLSNKLKEKDKEVNNKLEQLKEDIADEISYANRMNLTEDDFVRRVNKRIEELK